ncbi:hypothetical protein [Longimicrobium sp.]|uniref:hypothetical protein n=1 Tax=Longimicrobium sp. TaxID=2029185 RepID=UPI002BF0086B|nr:hypothetical protein [Longimicrobium sp.]HSU12899.1 hypothetical protein [Longimicrobium sp.]
MRRLALPLAALLAAACAPAAMSTPPAAAPPAMATAAPAMGGIIGNYTVTLADSDVPSAMPADAHAGLVGAWTVAIHPGNHFVATFKGNQVVEGHYEVNGNQITFPVGESGEYACTDPATYTWRRSGNQLTFAQVGQDACAGRAVVLTSHPLIAAP